MTDEAHAEKTLQLPYGATEIHLGSTEYSEELAARLLESGASDAAIDAAGGPGTADRLHEADAADARPKDSGSLAASGA